MPVGRNRLRLLSSMLKGGVPRSDFLFRLCARYVDWYNGENNGNMETNGELQFLRRYLNECRLVFDVGANAGEWTLKAFSINPGLTVHCFEPSRSTFDSLMRNCSGRDVIGNNFGLGSEAGEKTLYVMGEGEGINSLYRREGLEDFGIKPPESEEKVRIETLDDYCARHDVAEIDFLKIDVEGHELEVMKGMARILGEGRVRFVQFEYGGTYIDARVFLKDIWSFVLATNPGYSFYKLFPNEIRQIPRYGQSMENFRYQNWAIIRNQRP